MSPQANYDSRIRSEAWTAHQEMQCMKSKLQDELDDATHRGDTQKMLAVRQALEKGISRIKPTRLLTNLDQIYCESGKWKPSDQRSLDDRADDAGEVLNDAGVLGRHWRQLLTSYGVQNLPTNPIYNK